MVTYLEQPYEIVERPVMRKGTLLPGQDQFGYGLKITTDKVVVKDKRTYRVFCTQISNAGSCWIIKGGQKLFLHDA